MRLYELMGVFTTLSFAVPVCIILFLGLFVNKSLLSLSLFCAIAAVFNAMNSGLLTVDKKVLDGMGTFFSFADAPLMLVLLLLYCHTAAQKRVVLVCGGVYLLFELGVVLCLGFTDTSTVYTSGIGLLLVFILGTRFFVGQLRQTIRFNKGQGRTFIAAAIFFAYGLYGIVYFLNCIYEAPEIGDIILLYNITGIIFCALVTAGLVHLYRRHRQIKQLLVVRRELREFFGQEPLHRQYRTRFAQFFKKPHYPAGQKNYPGARAGVERAM